MYNAEVKTRFVQYYTKSLATAKACENAFRQVEPYEVAWDADLCTKTAKELQPMVDDIVGFRSVSKWMKMIILKDYVKWCLKVENVPGACDGMLKIKSVGLEKVRLRTVANPLQLQAYLNKLYTPESKQTIDNIYRCFYWLAYSGVPEEDILKIRCADVDFDNMVVRYHGTEFPIYRQAVPAFKNCATLTQFVFRPLNEKQCIWRDRAPGDLLVRNYGENAELSLYPYRVSMSRRSKRLGAGQPRLSYFRAWISGVFYRMYEQEAVGIEPDFYALAGQQMQGKKYKLDSGRNTIYAKRRQLARDYAEDYERWKLAFKV